MFWHKGGLGHTGGGHSVPDPGSPPEPPPLGFLQEEPGANAAETAHEEEHEEPQQDDEGEEGRHHEKVRGPAGWSHVRCVPTLRLQGHPGLGSTCHCYPESHGAAATT